MAPRRMDELLSHNSATQAIGDPYTPESGAAVQYFDLFGSVLEKNQVNSFGSS
jgi:hypothetical protein